jgi:hypothetical protein
MVSSFEIFKTDKSESIFGFCPKQHSVNNKEQTNRHIFLLIWLFLGVISESIFDPCPKQKAESLRK